MAFARHQFALAERQEDGKPLRVHLEVVSEKTGVLHPMLADAPPMPAGCAQLWHDFLELHYSRGSAGLDIGRITFADIHAWQQVRGIELSDWEIECIRKADNLWMAEFAPTGETVQ